jgi:hypothetical protein
VRGPLARAAQSASTPGRITTRSSGAAPLGVFLQPDEYVYLSHGGTLWSWPGQNPFRYRDPSGRDASEWFLRNAQTLQNGAEAVSAAALTIATGGLAGELLGFGSLESTLGALGLGEAASGAATVVNSGAAVTTTAVVAKAVANQCPPPTEAFSAAETSVVDEVRGFVDSGGLDKLKSALQAGGGEVEFGGRAIVVSPDMPMSGMTLGNDFAVGQAAFESDSELVQTLLHETYRITTGQSASGASQDAVTQYTSDAWDFAGRAYGAFFSQ